MEEKIERYSFRETSEKPPWEEIVVRLNTLKEWKEWTKTEGLDKFMEEVKPNILDRASEKGVLFRGIDPRYALELVVEGQGLELKATKPNATSQWRKAIAYGRGERRFNCVVGFWPENLDIRKSWEELPSGLPEEARKYQFENYIVSGNITPGDVRYLAVRFDTVKSAYYRIDQEKFEEYLSQK